jgi:hypothetical protein
MPKDVKKAATYLLTQLGFNVMRGRQVFADIINFLKYKHIKKWLATVEDALRRSTSKMSNFQNGWLFNMFDFQNVKFSKWLTFKYVQLPKHSTSKMANFQNGRLPKWSTSKMANFQNGRLPKWSTSKMVDFQNFGFQNFDFQRLSKWSTSKMSNWKWHYQFCLDHSWVLTPPQQGIG